MQRASNYAKALVEMDFPIENMDEIQKTLRENPMLSKILFSPCIPSIDKEEIMKQVFDNKSAELLRQLNRYKVLALFDEIYTFYQQYFDEKHGILRAKLLYVIRPTTEELNHITKMLKEKFLKKEVELVLEELPSLISGFIITSDHYVIDKSLRGQFERLEQNLIRR